MQKTVEIVVGKTLERPPLNSCSRYYKLYLPKDIIIDTNQYKLVNLNFKIKVPENITSHIISNTLLKQQQLEITGKFLPTDSRYKEVIIKLINKAQFLSFKFPKKKKKTQDYIFLLYQAKKLIHYTNLRNKIWQIILILHKLDFQQNQR